MLKNNNNGLEIVIQTKEIAYVFSLATSVVEKRNIVSELSNVKLVAYNGNLEIGATNLDLYFNQTIGAKVKKEGQSSVSLQILFEIVKKFPDKEILLKQVVGSQYLQVIGSSCKFDLPTLPAGNFPQMEDLESGIVFKISCEELGRIIEYTSFAMSAEETRYNLNGIYLHAKDKDFLSAATDAHRLSVAVSKVKVTIGDFGIILPKKTVIELLKIVKDTRNVHSDMLITIGINKVKFACNKLVLLSKLIDGNFPEYISFIPAYNKNKLIINTRLLANAIDRVSTVTVDRFKAIKILLDNTKIIITATGEAKGTANETINFSNDKESYCNFQGSNISIGFNPRYIIDVLNVLKEEQVHIYFNDSDSPALIKTLGNPKDSFVIMPVKV